MTVGTGVFFLCLFSFLAEAMQCMHNLLARIYHIIYQRLGKKDIRSQICTVHYCVYVRARSTNQKYH